MTRTYSFSVAGRAPAEPAEVFALLNDGAGWSRWARPIIVQSAWAKDVEPSGGPGAIRRVGFWPVRVREQVLEAVPGKLHAYTVLSPMPLLDYRADVHLEPAPGGGTTVTWTGRFTERVRGTGPVVRLGLRLMIRLLLGRLIARRAYETDKC